MYILYYILYLLLSYPLKNFLKTPFSFPKLIIPDFQQTKKKPAILSIQDTSLPL